MIVYWLNIIIIEQNQNTLGIKFHSQPVYDEKYIKTKLKEFSV